MDQNSVHFTTIKYFIEPNYTIFDIGACDGTDTALFASLVPMGKVVAIEPDKRCLDILKRKKFSRNIKVYSGAIGDYTGTIDFHPSSGHPTQKDGDWIASGSIKNPTTERNYPWLKFSKPYRVNCWTLDDFCARYKYQPDFLHIDIQGAEGDLIAGGQRTLSRARLINIECSEKGNYEGAIGKEEIMALLPTFRLVGQFGPDLLLEAR